jgi:hypothetical protein
VFRRTFVTGLYRKGIDRMGTLDIKGKSPQMPKDLDDRKLADL